MEPALSSTSFEIPALFFLLAWSQKQREFQNLLMIRLVPFFKLKTRYLYQATFEMNIRQILVIWQYCAAVRSSSWPVTRGQTPNITYVSVTAMLARWDSVEICLQDIRCWPNESSLVVQKGQQKNQVLIRGVCRNLNQQFSIQTQNEKEVWFQLRAWSVIYFTLHIPMCNGYSI